jgi:hypothetical protein
MHFTVHLALPNKYRNINTCDFMSNEDDEPSGFCTEVSVNTIQCYGLSACDQACAELQQNAAASRQTWCTLHKAFVGWSGGARR